MSDQNPYSPPPSGSSPSQDPDPYGRPGEGQQQQPPAQPYQQPGYQQPYQQPGYQQYPGYQQGYTGGGDGRETSTLAVVGFIVSLVGFVLPVALIGFILSLVALPRTGAGKKKGRGFAVAGAIIGGLLTLLGIAAIVLFGSIIADLASNFDEIDQDGDGTITNEELDDYFSEEGNEPWWFSSAGPADLPTDVPADAAAVVAVGSAA